MENGGAEEGSWTRGEIADAIREVADLELCLASCEQGLRNFFNLSWYDGPGVVRWRQPVKKWKGSHPRGRR
jgi:hypothetical protein